MKGNALGLEERVARIEGILEQMDKRFDQVDKRISEFREDFNARLNHLEAELRGLGNRIWWVMGVQISMWATIILAILIKCSQKIALTLISIRGFQSHASALEKEKRFQPGRFLASKLPQR